MPPRGTATIPSTFMGILSILAITPADFLTTPKKINHAIRISNLSTTSTPSLLPNATSAWKNIFDSPDLELAPSIFSLCQTIYGHILSRSGKDHDAIIAYDNALKMSLEKEAGLGKAKSLQRLMNYEEASKCYEEFGDLSSAATCFLRMGDWRSAKNMVKGGFLGAVSWMEYCDCAQINTISSPPDAIVRLLDEGRSNNILYQWLHHVFNSKKNFTHKREGKDTFLRLAAINASPFDFPQLYTVDNKVQLHYLLTNQYNFQKTQSFYPKSFVIPDESISFIKYTKNHPHISWILKDPTGYGSHGNRLLASSILPTEKMTLCQKIIIPPDSKRHFSMRLYVILFYDTSGKMKVYVSQKGLMKFASEPFDIDRQQTIATNSGRQGNDDNQQDLSHLKKQVKDFDKLWKELIKMVEIVMSCKEEGGKLWYESQVGDVIPSIHLAPLCIPKILGWDILLDENERPWLIEINRFPGLEPRGKNDEQVKRKVVGDAWRMIANYHGLDASVVDLESESMFLEEVNLSK